MPLPPENSGTLTIKDGSELKYGGKVSFNSEFPGQLKNPRVHVAAHQDGVLVHGEAGPADQVFPLGPPSYSKWVENGGGPAECVASLHYFAKEGGKSEWNGNGKQVYVLLDRITFHADA